MIKEEHDEPKQGPYRTAHSGGRCGAPCAGAESGTVHGIPANAGARLQAQHPCGTGIFRAESADSVHRNARAVGKDAVHDHARRGCCPLRQQGRCAVRSLRLFPDRAERTTAGLGDHPRQCGSDQGAAWQAGCRLSADDGVAGHPDGREHRGLYAFASDPAERIWHIPYLVCDGGADDHGRTAFAWRRTVSCQARQHGVYGACR